PIEQKEQTAIVIQEPIETLPIETPTTQPAPVKTNKNLKLQTPLIPRKKSTFRPSPIITSTQPLGIPLSNPVKSPQIESTDNQSTQTLGNTTTQLLPVNSSSSFITPTYKPLPKLSTPEHID